MSRPNFKVAALFCCIAALRSRVSADNVTFEGLGQLSRGGSTWCSDLSADGAAVVGRGITPTGFEGYRWTRQDGYQLLGHLPGGSPGTVDAHGVSPDGHFVVGQDARAGGPPFHAFRWSEGAGMVGLGDLPGGEFFSTAYGVSEHGLTIVGRSKSANFPNGEAFRWTTETGMVGLGWLPGGQSSTASDVSTDGRVIVGRASSSQGHQAFRWTLEDGMVGLGDLPGSVFQSMATAVSADGAVVVGTSLMAVEPGLSPNEPFIWDAQNGMRSLSAILREAGINLTGWDLETAQGVSADGLTILGEGRRPDGAVEPWIAHIPKPGTLALLLCAGALLRGLR